MENRSPGIEKMKKAMEDIKDGDFFQKIAAIFTVGGTALFTKANLKKAVVEAFDEIVSRLKSQLEKIERS
jgi:hypothetical protein